MVHARDYDWSYEYDAGGNRTLKKQAANVSVNPLRRFEEDYEYDVDDPAKYGTKNNRLMRIVHEVRLDAVFSNDRVGHVRHASGERALCFGDSDAHVLGLRKETQRLIATLAAYAA